jgi:hypothetical protein
MIRRLCVGASLAMAASFSLPVAAAVPVAKATYAVPPELGQLCTDTTRLEQALSGKLLPQPRALDQWTSLLRTLTCDLAGTQDLGWRPVRVRSYTSMLSYPLTWVEHQTRGGQERRTVRQYSSRGQMPQKLEFWVGGRIDEVQYDARRRTLAARFPAARSPQDPPGASCTGTRLSFRQQQGAWFLSGVETLGQQPCRIG